MTLTIRRDMSVEKTELKELAEFAFKFLKLGKAPPFHTTISDPNLLIDHLFHVSHLAPYYAHLAKREMEKRGFDSEMVYDCQTNDWTIDFIKWDENIEINVIGKATHENEYQALWLAIEQTGEK